MARKRRSFSRKFKLEAVGLMTDEGLSVAQAARYLGISESVLGRWKRQFVEDPAEAFPGKARSDLQHERQGQPLRQRLR